MDRGRGADVCGDRACGRLRRVPLGNGHVPFSDGHVPLADISCAPWARRRRGIQRSVWAGRRRSGRYGRQPVHVGLRDVDVRGSEGDRQRGVHDDISGRVELDLGECRYRPGETVLVLGTFNGTTIAATQVIVQPARQRIPGKGDPFQTRCTGHVKGGRSGPGRLRREPARSSAERRPTRRRRLRWPPTREAWSTVS